MTVLLLEVLQDKELGPSYAPNWTAFKKYTGLSDPLFKYYEGVCCFFDPYCRAPKEFKATTRGAERGKHFSIGMTGWGSVMDADYVINGILLKKLIHLHYLLSYL